MKPAAWCGCEGAASLNCIVLYFCQVNLQRGAKTDFFSEEAKKRHIVGRADEARPAATDWRVRSGIAAFASRSKKRSLGKQAGRRREVREVGEWTDGRTDGRASVNECVCSRVFTKCLPWRSLPTHRRRGPQTAGWAESSLADSQHDTMQHKKTQPRLTVADQAATIEQKTKRCTGIVLKNSSVLWFQQVLQN